jgi:predicted exporter
MDLRARLLDAGQPVFLYGTTPPRSGASPEQVLSAAEKLGARLGSLPLDGVVVYDIQDESGRTAQPRPFPFTATVDPRAYSALLRSRTGHATITYKALGALDEASWRAWLVESAQADMRLVSVVGRPTSGVQYALSLSRAVRIAAEHPARFMIGGVAIAERHTETRSEAARLLAKGVEGCSFFISQAVYHAPPTQRMLAEYLRDCRGAGVAPQRVVLTFAPCGREKTLGFLRWLGVNIAEDTARSILDAARPLERSIEICRDNLRRILDAPCAAAIPLGINVESVSINRDEIDATVELFGVLRETLSGR